MDDAAHLWHPTEKVINKNISADAKSSSYMNLHLRIQYKIPLIPLSKQEVVKMFG